MKLMTLKNSTGYTMVELVLVILLMSILGYAAIPKSPTTMASFSLDAGARQIKADIRYAQNLATTTGDSYGFRTTGASTYEIYNVSTGAVATSPTTQAPLQQDMTASYGNVAFQTSYRIEFNSIGKPTVGGGTIVNLVEGESMKQIQVTSTSGYVSLLD